MAKNKYLIIRIYISLILILLTATFTLLTACDPEGYYFDYKELKSNVVAVELINYNAMDIETVYKQEDVWSYNYDAVTVVDKLAVEQIDTFCYDLSNIYFHLCDSLTKYYSSASGISIKVTFKNDDFIVFCINKQCNFVGSFDFDGNTGEFMGQFTDIKDFNYLVNKYFSN